MLRRRASLTILLALSLTAAGCVLDRGGIAPDGTRDAGPRPDGGSRPSDAQVDAGRDSGEPCVPSGPELCNGEDDDCDPSTADGADEGTLGDACDDPEDADSCAEGAIACSGGALTCAGDDGDQPDEIEACDGMDNDCDPSTADGAGDPMLGASCDDGDHDACADGALVCEGGALSCTGEDGDQPDEIELCNGLDDDCDPATPDGAAEAWLGAACDDPADADLCPEGTYACSGGAMVCAGDDGDGADEVEVCDGMDNDCNAATADGASDPMLGTPCDDPGDADLCPEGARACSGGALACAGDDGNQPGEVELCDGVDNDCNALTLDGAGETFGSRCDGPDADMCREGMTTGCTAGVLVCSDATGDSVETCNGADDDCDGVVDDGAGCPCTRVARGSRSYLFCGADTDRQQWWDARDFCRARGYELVTIGDAGEQSFVTTQTTAISTNPWWTGANDLGGSSEGTFTWVADGSALTYTAWQTGQPNNSGGNQDCVVLEPSVAIGTSTTLGGWNDGECWFTFRFVCEAGP